MIIKSWIETFKKLENCSIVSLLNDSIDMKDVEKEINEMSVDKFCLTYSIPLPNNAYKFVSVFKNEITIFVFARVVEEI